MMHNLINADWGFKLLIVAGLAMVYFTVIYPNSRINKTETIAQKAKLQTKK